MGVSEVLLCPYRCLEYKMESFTYLSPQPVVRSTSCFVLGGVFEDGKSNGAIFDSNKFKMAAAAILDNFEWPYLHNGSTYIAHIARSSLR